MSSFSGSHRGSGPGERVPEGTHFDVLLRLEAAASNTSPGDAARISRTLGDSCTETATVLGRILQRETGKPTPPSRTPNLPPRP